MNLMRVHVGWQEICKSDDLILFATFLSTKKKERPTESVLIQIRERTEKLVDKA